MSCKYGDNVVSPPSLSYLSRKVVEVEADKLREKGNQHYSDSEFRQALQMYIYACTRYKEIHSVVWEAKANSNISLTYLKLKEPKKAYDFAEKSLHLDPKMAKAYYRRAQALEMMNRYEECTKDYITSYEFDPQQVTFYSALKAAPAKHSFSVWGIPVDYKYHKLLCDHESSDTDTLYKLSVEQKLFGLIPILAFILKANTDSHGIVQAIDWPESESEVREMVCSMTNHSKYLANSDHHGMLRAPKILGARLVVAAISGCRTQVVELFLNELDIEWDDIDISKLLEKTELRYKPEWLRKMFERGATLKKCQCNPVKVVLENPQEQPLQQLEMIKILVDCGASVDFEIPHTTVLNEVVKITMKCQDAFCVDTLRLVCDRFSFGSQRECDENGQTPWHLALGAKRSKVSIEVCKVLIDYPIDVSQRDKNGNKADFKKKETDLRVIEFRKKEAELKENQKATRNPEIIKMKQRRKRKARKSSEKYTVPESKKQTEEKIAVIEQTEVVLSDSTAESVREDDENAVTQDGHSLKQLLERLHKHEDEYFHCIPTRLEMPAEPPSKPASPTSPDMPLVTTVTKGVTVTETEMKKYSIEYGDFDEQPWKIECSKKVMKVLSGRKYKHIKRLFLQKLMILAQGEFVENKKHCKSVSDKKGLELYETRLNEKIRIIWQIVPQFFPQSCTTNKSTKQLQSPYNRAHTYVDIIRVWDVVFDHDNIHRCVANIEKNIDGRGCHAPQVVGLKCISSKSGIKSNRRMPKEFVSEKIERETLLFPPKTQEGGSYTIARLYSFSTNVVKLMLQDGDIEKAFPYKEWPEEHDIINLDYKEAILLLGRSGTGKTTCCLYRMWNEFKHYWKNSLDVAFSSIPKRQLSLPCQESVASEEDTSASNPPKSILCERDKENGSILEYDTPGYEESKTCSADLDTYDHLHQVFVTKNYVLCSRLRKQFYKFADAEECAKNHMQKKGEKLPHHLASIHDLCYPLFLTARQLYIMMDYSLHDGNYFFKRDADGNMMEKILSSDYDHEDMDILYDFDDSEDEDTFHGLFPTRDNHLDMKKRREVTASYFDKCIWPKICGSACMSSLMVWMEIKSYIKGSREAIESETGFLTREEYIDMGKKAAPHFSGKREEVYDVFESYRFYVQNHPSENLFDECDFIHHLFQKLPKDAKELKWAWHSIYIDEVQDFTQGELWLMLHNCRDPNGLFFTGDTAQSIMSGIAFRFEDLRTLFYHMKEQNHYKVAVPVVKHLTVNFRAHAQILKLATSVTNLLMEYFPYSFDHKGIPHEEGLVDGAKPVFLDNCSPSDLAVAFVGNKRTSSIDFGANQAILVRNQKARICLPKALTSAIVLTIFESKGLEFDDVLLYNFFTDSDLSDEWRVLASNHDDTLMSSGHKSEGDRVSSSKRPHPLEFTEEKHKQLCPELKHLYTAITRTKAKLWLYECGEAHHPILWHWQQSGFVDVKHLSEISYQSDEFESTSTPEDWETRGIEFQQHKLWKEAGKCFQKAGCHHKVKECEAFIHLQKATDLHNEADKRNSYLSAAISFLECDYVKHTPKALVRAAKCLFNGKSYEDAAYLYRRLKKLEKAGICYHLSKKCDQCIELMEEQHMHKDAVTHMFLSDKNRAVELASKYIRQKVIGPEVIADRIIQHGKRLIKAVSVKGEKTKLLDVLEVINPELQVHYLKQVGAYGEAADLLMGLHKTEDAFELMLAQTMYKEALKLAKEKKKQHKTLLAAAKTKLCNNESFQTGILDLNTELQTICQDGSVNRSVRGMACLLLSKLTEDDKLCHEALQFFHQDNNTLGECETLVLLLPRVKRNIKYVEMTVKACNATKKICITLNTMSDRRTATFMHVVHQVEDFYGITKEGMEYHLPVHQDMWNILPELDSSTSKQPQSNNILKAICSHLDSNIRKLMGDITTQNIVQCTLDRFEFHHKEIERPSNYDTNQLLEYIKAYSLSLEILQQQESEDFKMWTRCLLNLLKLNGLLNCTLTKEHFAVMKEFPSAIGILEHQLESGLKTPVHKLRQDDWMEMWIISHILTGEDSMLEKITRMVPTISLSNESKHFFVKSRCDFWSEPHFCRWIQSCQLLRQGSKSLIAIRVLISYLETITRLNEKISISTTVFMLGVSTMILYGFLCLSLPKGTNIVVPQLLVDMMNCFDRVNCQGKNDIPILQSCFTTYKCIRAYQAKSVLQSGIAQIFHVLIGGILQNAVTNTQCKNDIVICITLGLTLVGNMSLSNLYKPHNLLHYQNGIFDALKPIMDQPDHDLRPICEKFAQCTSSRALFAVVKELNKLQGRNDLLRFQLTKNGHQLNPTNPQRILENSMLPLQLINCQRVSGPEAAATDLSGATVQAFETNLGNQSSNEYGLEKELVEALGVEEDPDQMVRQVSTDNTIADEEFCRVCSTELTTEASTRTGVSTTLREHVASVEHKDNVVAYRDFLQVTEDLSTQIKEWKQQLQIWESQEESVRSELLLHKIREQILQLESIQDTTERSGQWQDGTEKFARAKYVIVKLIQEGNQQQDTPTLMKDEPHEIEPTAVDVPSDEDVLSSDEETPRQARRKKRTK